MSNAQRTVKYPKALLLLPQDEWLTDTDIAKQLQVSLRTVYRWYTSGYLKREIKENLTTYTVNTNKRPEMVVKVNKTAPKRFTTAELDAIYQKVMDGEMKLPMVDIAKHVRDEATIEELQTILKGLEDYHEFVSFVLANKR